MFSNKFHIFSANRHDFMPYNSEYIGYILHMFGMFVCSCVVSEVCIISGWLKIAFHNFKNGFHTIIYR